MKNLHSYSSAEIANLPSDVWVRADSHYYAARELEREIALMFSPREHLEIVQERDRAQNLAWFYEKALAAIAAAAGKEMNSAAATVDQLATTVVERLLAERANAKKKKKSTAASKLKS